MMKYSLFLLVLVFCTVLHADDTSDEFSGAETATDVFVEADASPQPNDGLENLNRKVSAFNDSVDRIFLKPVAQGYQKVTPSIINRGITNIFTLLGEIPNAGNALLQNKPMAAGDSVLRFLINSTVGVLGFFDVASAIGIDEHEEDFAQTLAYWGIPQGRYIVLPFWGPSTVRDVHGKVLDGFIDPLNQIESVSAYAVVRSIDIVDTRADLLKAEELVTGDRYSFLKNAYLQNRHYLENDGKVEDTFDNGQLDEGDEWMD